MRWIPKWGLCISISIALVVAGYVLGILSASPHPAGHKGAASNSAQAYKPHDEALTVADVKALIQDTDTGNEQDNAWENTAINRGIEVFTGILVIVNALSLAGLIWYALLTKQAADAAAKSADTGEKALVLIERPWVTFKPPKTVTATDRYSFPKVAAAIVTNTGANPAFMKSLGAYFCYGPDPPNALSAIRIVFGQKSNGVIPPAEIIQLRPATIPQDLPPTDNVYVVVGARYTDIFGAKHRSLCIWQWDADSGAFGLIYSPEFLSYT